MRRLLLLFLIPVCLVLLTGYYQDSLDEKLQYILHQHGITGLDPGPQPDSAKVELGQMLYFDKILSGNKDISCATCHHPSLATGDSLVMSIGVGGEGLGTSRKMDVDRDRIPRNATEIFNRGAEEWHTMFWDSRVSRTSEESFETPAEEDLPEGLDNILAAQAMFPVLARDEMRGEIGDRDVHGQENELALMSAGMQSSIWHGLMQRLRAIPEYLQMFKAAYPDIPIEELGFQHAANAIAAFEIEAFTLLDSPWDRYLNGDSLALSEEAKRGALLFYGKANCGACHSGPLMTDQRHHNIGVPQLGPGKGDARPLDPGRYLETGNPSDRFAFRTPPLRNVALTGPWMHNGAYNNLEDVIRQHLDPVYALKHYDAGALESELQRTVKREGSVQAKILSTPDPLVAEPINLSEQEIEELITFLHSLTDSAALGLDQITPASVPSGLSLED